MTDAPSPAPAAPEKCPHCHKPPALCVCDSVVPLDNKVSVLILQHPQEQDVALGTARLTARQLSNAMLKVGLSWPNLGKILGRDVDPQHWAVVYLGSAKPEEIAPEREIVLLNRKGEAEREQDSTLRRIEGVVLLDGTWSQAKALWWRNPWMLKCRRLVLNPKVPSRYGKVRREPRRDALSTLEAAAILLSRIERRPEIESTLMATFDRMLEKYRASGQKAARPRRDFRRRTSRGRDRAARLH
jgi:DTW domain-containing protein YfiP